MNVKIHTHLLGLTTFLFILSNLTGCGTGGLTRDDSASSTDTTQTVTVSGTVNTVTTPSGGSSNISALKRPGFFKFVTEDTPSGSTPITIYAIDDSGSQALASTTTAADGSYSFTLSLSDLDPNDDGSTVSLVIESDNAEISDFKEITPEAGDAVVMNPNFDTTMAVEEIRQVLASASGVDTIDWATFSGWDSADINYDLECFQRFNKQKWAIARSDTPTFETASAALSPIATLIAAQAINDDTGGYDNFSEEYQALLEGTAGVSLVGTAASRAVAGELTKASTGALIGAMQDAPTNNNEFNTSITSIFSNASLANDFCSDLSDSSFLENSVDALLNLSDISAVTTALSGGFESFYLTLQEYQQPDGSYNFSTNWNAQAMAGALELRNGTFTNYDVDNVISGLGALSGVNNIDNYRDLAQAYFANMDSDSTADPDKVAGYWAFRVENGYTYSSSGTNPATEYNRIISAGLDPAECLNPSSSACTSIATQMTASRAGNYAGAYTRTSRTGICPAAFGATLALQRDSPGNFSNPAGTFTLVVSDLESCTATLNSQATNSCSITGVGGAAGSTFHVTTGLSCDVTYTHN